MAPLSPLLFLDTHAVVLLAQNQAQRFSTRGRRLIERSQVRISPFVALELQFLAEIGRIKQPPGKFLPDLMRRLNADALGQESLSLIIEKAEQLSWTRDAFDRLIVAHAAALQAQLLTRDEQIQKHYPKATW